MLVILKGIIIECDGPTILYRDNFRFEISKGEKNVFARDSIIERILKAQQDGTITRKWLSEEEFDRHKKNDKLYTDLINMTTFHFTNAYPGCEAGDGTYMTDYIDIGVWPEKTNEFDLYFQTYLESVYHNKKAVNGVLQLCRWNEISDDHEVIEVGNYITLHAFSQYTGRHNSDGTHESNEFYYVIKKTSLQKHTIPISAPEDLVPHLIGKAGKRIKVAKELLEAYTNEDHSIKLIQ